MAKTDSDLPILWNQMSGAGSSVYSSTPQKLPAIVSNKKNEH